MRRSLLLLLTAAAALAVSLLFMEVVVRIWISPPSDGPALSLIDRKAPYVFSLNPEHPEISPQGLRGQEAVIPKPAGVKRVLVLGDSLAYGLFVPAGETFPREMERLLKQKDNAFEVINAGVNGYTTFNEVRFFQSEGVRYEPDHVILAFCFNDIVNPVLHWGEEGDFFKDLPREAFARYEDHLQRVKPALYGPRSAASRLLEKSHLYRFLLSRWKLWQMRTLRYQEQGGRRWPVYTADEDPVSLRALEDPLSPESVWLYGLLRELRAGVEASGARLHVVFFPLAYQFTPGYPFFPQKTLTRFCEREGLSCLDPYEALLEAGGRSLYLGRHRYHPRDVWHFSARGHKAAGRILAEWLQTEIQRKEVR